MLVNHDYQYTYMLIKLWANHRNQKVKNLDIARYYDDIRYKVVHGLYVIKFDKICTWKTAQSKASLWKN